MEILLYLSNVSSQQPPKQSQRGEICHRDLLNRQCKLPLRPSIATTPSDGFINWITLAQLISSLHLQLISIIVPRLPACLPACPASSRSKLAKEGQISFASVVPLRAPPPPDITFSTSPTWWWPALHPTPLAKPPSNVNQGWAPFHRCRFLGLSLSEIDLETILSSLSSPKYGSHTTYSASTTPCPPPNTFHCA